MIVGDAEEEANPKKGVALQVSLLISSNDFEPQEGGELISMVCFVIPTCYIDLVAWLRIPFHHSCLSKDTKRQQSHRSYISIKRFVRSA